MKEAQHISTTELRNNLSEVLDDVEEGEEFVVERRGEPVATLRPPAPASRSGVLSDEEIEAIKSRRPKRPIKEALGLGPRLVGQEAWDRYMDEMQRIREQSRREAQNRDGD